MLKIQILGTLLVVLCLSTIVIANNVTIRDANKEINIDDSIYDNWNLLRTIFIGNNRNIDSLVTLSEGKAIILTYIESGFENIDFRLEMWNLLTSEKLWTCNVDAQSYISSIKELHDGNILLYVPERSMQVYNSTNGTLLHKIDWKDLEYYALLHNRRVSMFNDSIVKVNGFNTIELISTEEHNFGQTIEHSEKFDHIKNILVHGDYIYFLDNDVIHEWHVYTNQYTCIDNGFITADISELYTILSENIWVYSLYYSGNVIRCGNILMEHVNYEHASDKYNIISYDSDGSGHSQFYYHYHSTIDKVSPALHDVIVLPSGHLVSTVQHVLSNINIWNPHTGELVKSIPTDSSYLVSIDFLLEKSDSTKTSDSQLVSASENGVIKVWGSTIDVKY